MVWIVFGLCLAGIIAILGFIAVYMVRNNTLQKKVDYIQRLFDNHFKTTDQTIVDTRKERDYWKKVALRKKKL